MASSGLPELALDLWTVQSEDLLLAKVRGSFLRCFRLSDPSSEVSGVTSAVAAALGGKDEGIFVQAFVIFKHS